MSALDVFGDSRESFRQAGGYNIDEKFTPDSPLCSFLSCFLN